MNKALFLFLTLHFLFTFSTAAASMNPEEVYSKLSEKQTIIILDNYEVSYITEKQFIIYNAEGLSHAYTSLFYDKLNRIERFELEMKDVKSGKTLQKAKIKDMIDVAIYSNSTVFDDNRRKFYELKSGTFPIEVNIITETKSSTNFNLPTWIPVHRYNQKIEKSSLTVIYPKEIGLRYLEKNLLGTKEEKEENGIMSITWQETDLPVQEPDMNEEDDHRVLLAPVNFSVEDFKGEMNDWSGMADWLYRLNAGRDQLPEELKIKVHELTDGLDNSYDKIQVLYSYLQENFRYVSIQLGIGGWQTISSEEVSKYAYGDCKGLTNIMKAMLAEASIDSNYTLVFAGDGEEDIEVDFPSNQFNHVILQVPTESDPIWLECTSNLLPAGYLGSFTKNRHVLVTKEGGGYLTKTPNYSDSVWNQSRSSTSIKLDDRGDAWIETDFQIKGNYAEDLIYVKNSFDDRKQKDFFNRNSPISGLIINDLRFDLEHVDSLPIAVLSYEGMIQKFVQRTTKRIILKPFMGKISDEMLSSNRLLKTDDYKIELGQELMLESNIQPVLYEEEGIRIFIESSQEGTDLKVKRSIDLTLSEDMDEEERADVIKKINSKATKTYVFLKPETNTKQ